MDNGRDQEVIVCGQVMRGVLCCRLALANVVLNCNFPGQRGCNASDPGMVSLETIGAIIPKVLSSGSNDGTRSILPLKEGNCALVLAIRCTSFQRAIGINRESFIRCSCLSPCRDGEGRVGDVLVCSNRILDPAGHGWTRQSAW